MRILSILLALTLILSAARQAGAATPKASELVQAQLLADVSAVKPGEEFTLGVLLKIKPKWHIYWKYPGDAGLPTTVKWKLPDASETSPQPELRFPFPVRFDQPGDVVGYGYKDEVLLTARVKAPQGLAGSTHDYAANVAYLVCEDVCIPGKATVKLSILLADETKPANTDLFDKWVAQLPKSEAKAADNALQLQKTADREFAAKVDLPLAGTAKDIEWFPIPPKGSGVEDAQTKTEGNESSFSFSLVPLPKELLKMQFLVTYTDSSGKRQGIEFDENLPASLPK